MSKNIARPENGKKMLNMITSTDPFNDPCVKYFSTLMIQKYANRSGSSLKDRKVNNQMPKYSEEL